MSVTILGLLDDGTVENSVTCVVFMVIQGDGGNDGWYECVEV